MKGAKFFEVIFEINKAKTTDHAVHRRVFFDEV